MKHRSLVSISLAVGAMLFLPAQLPAQVYYGGHTHGYPCAPWGPSYSVYPYGNWPGYPAVNPSGGGLGGYSTPGQYGSYPTSAANDRVMLPYTPKYRADAYGVNVLAQYGLPPHPSQYVPPVVPKGKVAAAGLNNGSGEKRAKVDVHLPTAQAEVWVQGVQMKTGGKVRQFISPPLGADGPYQYKVEARWQADGQVQTQTKYVSVQPGNNQMVLFE